MKYRGAGVGLKADKAFCEFCEFFLFSDMTRLKPVEKLTTQNRGSIFVRNKFPSKISLCGRYLPCSGPTP